MQSTSLSIFIFKLFPFTLRRLSISLPFPVSLSLSLLLLVRIVVSRSDLAPGFFPSVRRRMTSRSSAWGDGTRSNVHESAEAIHESFRELVCQEHFYVSEDMTQGVDVDGLTVHADLLASIIKLDLLGVRHLDIEEAVQQLSEMPDVRAAFEAMAVAHRKQSKDLVVSLAFSLGVMLAHVRLKHSQFQRLKSCETMDRAWSHPEKLRALRALFDASWKPLSSPKTQPFLFFHDVSEEACEDSDDFELLVLVTKVLTWGDDIVCGDHAYEFTVAMSSPTATTRVQFSSRQSFLAARRWQRAFQTRGSLHLSPSVGIATQGAGKATGTEAEGPRPRTRPHRRSRPN